MMKIKYVFIAIFVTCVTGCQTRCQCPKERSYLTAMQILQTSDEQEIICKIKLCDDVDALRIIAFTASVAAWPMEAGPDVNFDNKMDGVVVTAIDRLYAIDSDSANASIEFYKRAFPPDGAYSFFFKEWEEKRKSLRPKRKSDVREPNTTNAAGSDPIGGVGSGGVGEICEGHPFFATGETPVVPVSQSTLLRTFPLFHSHRNVVPDPKFVGTGPRADFLL